MTTRLAQPPPARKGRWKYDWQGIADALVANPGSWVLVGEKVTSGLSQKVRNGHVPVLPTLGGILEVVERNTHYEPDHPNTRRGDLYLRWNPKPNTHPTD